MKPIRFHPEADAEVTEAVEFYEDRSSGLGSALLVELDIAVDGHPAFQIPMIPVSGFILISMIQSLLASFIRNP